MHIRTCACATYDASNNDELELITPHMLINTWQQLEYRLECNICGATTGAHIEVYGRV